MVRAESQIRVVMSTLIDYYLSSLSASPLVQEPTDITVATHWVRPVCFHESLDLTDIEYLSDILLCSWSLRNIQLRFSASPSNMESLPANQTPTLFLLAFSRTWSLSCANILPLSIYAFSLSISLPSRT